MSGTVSCGGKTNLLQEIRFLTPFLPGEITATYSYDTFGTVTVLLGSITDTRYQFTCQEYDLTTGKYLYDARWYDPTLGKFISEDPSSSDVNLFRYCNNAPLNGIDPTGCYTLEWGDEWTDEEKVIIEASLQRILQQCLSRREWILKEIKEANELGLCVIRRLRHILFPMADYFNAVIEGINSNDNLELYHHPFDDDNILGYVRGVGLGWFFDPHLNLNDDPKSDWHKRPDRYLDELLFHELTHLYNSTDNTSDLLDFFSAHVLQSMLYSDNGLLAYEQYKKEVLKECCKN